jgi:hypothetical protein
MSAVLQSEVRLHEGILAALTLQDAWSDRVPEQRELAARMEQAIANLRTAVQTDAAGARLEARLLPLLFNLQEAIAGSKRSLATVLAFAQTLEDRDAEHRKFLQQHAAVLAEGTEWMEELADAWSLSLDRGWMSEIEGRLVDAPRPAEEIRDWRTVLAEVERDAEVRD